MSDVELVGGTAKTAKWHDHRVMLISPQDITGLVGGDRDTLQRIVASFAACPPVWADEDAIRWLTSRQMRDRSRCACGEAISYGRGDSTRCPDCWERERVG